MVLHEDELAAWLTYLNSLPNTRANRRFRVICDTLLASALRINELLALTIQDLDFEANEILVNKTLMWKAGNKNLVSRARWFVKIVLKQTQEIVVLLFQDKF